MKIGIDFEFIKTNGGADFLVSEIYRGCIKNNLNCKIKFWNSKLQIFPQIIKLIYKNKNYRMIQSDIFGYPFKKKDSKLIVIVYHLFDDPIYKKYDTFLSKIYHYVLSLYQNKTLQIADSIIAISKYTQRRLKKKGFDSHMIYCGIDTNVFKPLKIFKKNKKIRIFFSGNLIKRKGADLLPKIMEKLGSDYILYYTSGLRDKIPKNFNLPNMVSLGNLKKEELIKEYNKCDVYLLPTRLEGFGLSIVEAMACGKPIVSTKCSSIQEIIENGKNGFLCELDNVDDFVKKIRILGNSKGLRDTIGIVNREKALKRFSKEKMIKNFIKFYKKLLK